MTISKPKPARDLCIMACIFCKEPEFLAWLGSRAGCQANEAGAKAFILTACGVKSRNELDTSPTAAERFHELVRKPFLQWKNPEQYDDTFYSGINIAGADVTPK